MNSLHCRLLIIGSGPAGYTAAIYAARANLAPVLVQGMQPGGQLMITTDVENYPGFADPIQGPWLMEQMAKQAEHQGTKLITDLITAVDCRARPITATGDSGTRYTADALVIATGAQARWLGLPSEAFFQGFGVSACATCDGPLYRNKNVVVVGGGNAAVEEALFLSHLCRQVTVVHRRDRFRGEKVLHDRLLARPNVSVRWHSVVEEILGVTTPHKSVTGVRLRDVRSAAQEELAIDGLFVAIGHDPATGLFRGQLPMDEAGYILTAPDSTATGIPGIFAAGDVKDKIFRQAVTAAGMGCMAALEAERFLSAQDAPALAPARAHG